MAKRASPFFFSRSFGHRYIIWTFEGRLDLPGLTFSDSNFPTLFLERWYFLYNIIGIVAFELCFAFFERGELTSIPSRIMQRKRLILHHHYAILQSSKAYHSKSLCLFRSMYLREQLLQARYKPISTPSTSMSPKVSARTFIPSENPYNYTVYYPYDFTYTLSRMEGQEVGSYPLTEELLAFICKALNARLKCPNGVDARSLYKKINSHTDEPMVVYIGKMK